MFDRNFGKKSCAKRDSSVGKSHLDELKVSGVVLRRISEQVLREILLFRFCEAAVNALSDFTSFNHYSLHDFNGDL